MQIGILIIAFEYERQRRKDVLKKQQEAMERQAVLDKARAEREVGRTGTGAQGIGHRG